jgi:2-polyprenyl-6-methoxyphenol hydroxylase-like FAD-dependent oxidoreductase
MYVEQHVFDHLKTIPTIELRYGWRCVGWSEAADGLEVAIEEDSSGRKDNVRCQYLVGCDGGQSFVRRQLGIRYSGHAANANRAYLSGAMVSTHFRVPNFQTRFPHRMGWQNWTLNGTLRSNVISLNGHDEILMSSQLPSADHKPDDNLIAQRLIGAAGEALDFELIGHWTWTPGRALVADSYGRGRVFLAGDSAHLFTPTGGFGMNTGITDAANLAWKLAAVVQGWGAPALLASYESECRPIGLRNTGTARFFTNNVSSLQVPVEIEEDSPRGAEIRVRIGRAAHTFGEEFASIGIQLGARYDGSPIILSDGAQPPADDPFTYTPTGIPGGRAPHVWLPDRTSLYDHFGLGFTLLMLADGPARGSAVAKLAARRGIPLKVLRVEIPEARELYGADLALIRPDQYVAWRGNDLRDIDRVLATVTGH